MKIQVHGKGTVAFGGNPVVDATVEGLFPAGPVSVVFMRQGGLGIWAFPGRPELTREQCHELDAALDAAWEGSNPASPAEEGEQAARMDARSGIPAHFKSACAGGVCRNPECAEAVKANEAGRWYVTMGHAGFNSRANNGNGYKSARAARKAFQFYTIGRK